MHKKLRNIHRSGKILSIKLLFILIYHAVECSVEPSHWDGSFEYLQHLFWLRDNKNNFQLHTVIWVGGGGGGADIQTISMQKKKRTSCFSLNIISSAWQ